MKAETAGIKTIKIINSVVSNVVLVIVVALVAFATYALWDSRQIYKAADKSNYEIYKPVKEDEGMAFKELQAINPEVIAWLEVYGTNIDYPVTQSEDNTKYVNTNALGVYSLTGAIFLDADNSGDFSDFSSILYGHHMEKNVLFGEIGSFSEKSVFDSRRYGNLHFEENDHGIEFFAYIHTDAYDRSILSTNIAETEQRRYLTNLFKKAINKRDVKFAGPDRIILLVTCSTESTNGRDILAGRITDEVFADPFKGADPDGGKRQAPGDPFGYIKEGLIWPLLALIVLIRIIFFVISNNLKKKKLKQEKGA